ncbi:MAG TPA: DUF1761 domain-containing protein [Gammaproteobacteria bacterium]
MNSKFLLSATLAYVALSMVIAVPWHFVLFDELYHRLAIYNREPPIVVLGMLSMLIQGIVLAYLYPGFPKSGRPVFDGVGFGLVTGAFLFSVSTLANAAKMQVTSMADFILIQAAFHAVQFVIVGMSIGMLHEKLKRS